MSGNNASGNRKTDAAAAGALSSMIGKSAGTESDGYVPMRDRFKAWWNGEDVEVLTKVAGSPSGGMSITLDAPEDDDDEDEDDVWSAGRLALIQEIWGEGFIEPGGKAFTKTLLGWLGLNSRQSVLDLTAGLGGTARAVATAHNLWMDVLEPVAALATEARRQSLAHGLGRQVPVSLTNLESHDLAKGRYDAIYSRERLFTVRNKAGLLSSCVGALKKKGQILVTDYMRAEGVGGAALAEAWGRHEKQTPNAWTMTAYTDCLKSQGLSILIAQDISSEFVEHVNEAWRRVPTMISSGKYSRRQIGYLVREGEIWQSRLKAIDQGLLMVGRIHARKVPGKA